MQVVAFHWGEFLQFWKSLVGDAAAIVGTVREAGHYNAHAIPVPACVNEQNQGRPAWDDILQDKIQYFFIDF